MIIFKYGTWNNSPDIKLFSYEFEFYMIKFNFKSILGDTLYKVGKLVKWVKLATFTSILMTKHLGK